MTTSFPLDDRPERPETLLLNLYGQSFMTLTLRGDVTSERALLFRQACKDSDATIDRNNRQAMVLRSSVGELLARLIALDFTTTVAPAVQLALDFDAKTVRDRAAAEARKNAEKLTAVDRRIAAHDGLYPFQIEGVRWLATGESSKLLCDEMGLGKTLQTLVALDHGERGSAPPGVLVCCPANAKGVWARECKAHRPDFRIVMLKGLGNFRWPAPGEMVIANYDILPKPADIDTSPSGKCQLVGDEIHLCKIAKSQRTVRFRAIREKVTNCGGTTWGLTGTPLPDRAQDLWTIAQAFGLARVAFGTWDGFVELYQGERVDCPKCAGGKKKPLKCSGCHGAGALEGTPCPKCGGSGNAVCKVCKDKRFILGDLLTPTAEVKERFAKIALRRLRADVLPDLPTFRAQVHDVELGEQAIDEIEQNLPDGWEDILADVLDSADAELAIGELARARASLATAKIPAALELAESFGEANEPLVFFSCHTEPLEALARLEGWALINGATPAKKRTEIEEAFQRGELKGIAGNVRAAGTALTLTRACNVAFIDESWTPAENMQARDRVVRIGQTRGVILHRLVADHPLDIRVAEILETKRKLIEGSLGG